MKRGSVLVVFVIFISLAFSNCKNQKENAIKSESKQGVEKETTKRFFSDDSFWNQPIAHDAAIDPRNDKWIKMLEQEPSGKNFGLSWREWTIPVYEVDKNTPTYNVAYHYLSDVEKGVWNTVIARDKFGHGPNFNPVPIPENALPDAENDAHLAIVDREKQIAWDMWGLKKLEDGSWESKTGMTYRLDGDGIFDGEKLGYVDDESVHFHGPSRAAGVPIFAGLIMYDEIMSGKISHKLSCAIRYAAHREFVYPATWTDGYVEGGIPEGAVIRLNPQLDLSQFDLTKEETVIAIALQEYGMVIVDIAQGQPIYAEGLWGHPGKSWEGKLREWDGGIGSIPYKNYQIMNVENAIKKGDNRIINGSMFGENIF